jgi:Fe-S oxidoreductase
LLTLFDSIFIIAALITLWIGISRLQTLRTSKRKETLSGDFAGLIRYLAGHKKIKGKPVTGTLHFIIFWGCFFFILMIIPAQMGLIFPKSIAGGISFVMDMTGFLMLAAILHFLVNLFHTDKAKRVPGKFILLFLLLIIVLTGFLSAGSRLKIIQGGFSMVSPIGSAFSVISPDSPLFMQAMIRLHFLGVLIFFALIPFSFFRHIPAGLQNVYSKQRLNPGELSPVEWDASPIGAKTIFDLSSKPLLSAQACVSCRRCEDNCPATISHKPLNPRQIMVTLFNRMTKDAGFFHGLRPARDLEQDISGDEIWACTTCTACATHCPMMINPMDIIMALRSHQVLDKGFVPLEARHMIRNLELFGDPFGKGVSYRTDWRIGLNVPCVRELPEKPEILLWVGCSGAFHPRYGNVARDMARILEAAGVGFAIPGKDELCCGDGARRLGEEALFQNLAFRNIETLGSYGIKDIVVFCPHCYNTLKNEYPAFGGTFNVIPAVEYLLMLIDQKKIIPAYPINKEMTLHDPCYLGRVNGIYKPLRKLVERIPGLTLKELNRSFDTALCCGGGGGRMWLHETIGEKINHLRAGEIMESGVDLLGTACPFCMTMMEDGIGSVSAENELKILDLIEITAQSIGVADKGKS